MQLINLPVSPFAARVRIALRAKNLSVELLPPPAGWPNLPRFRDMSPTGRIPVLICDDGRVISESWVILEYLEESCPDARPLLPPEPGERAAVRLLGRSVDLYLMPPLVALAQPCDARARRRQVSELLEAIELLDRMMEGGDSYAVGDDLTLADCALAPALFATRVTGERLDLELIAGHDRLDRYAATIAEDEHVNAVIMEMEEGLASLSQAQSS